MNIFGTILIITDSNDEWLSLLQNNIKIESISQEENYIIIYTELGNFILSQTLEKQTSHYITNIIIDKEVSQEELNNLFPVRYILTTEKGELKFEINTE